jgi:hypothetical protein
MQSLRHDDFAAHVVGHGCVNKVHASEIRIVTQEIQAILQRASLICVSVVGRGSHRDLKVAVAVGVTALADYSCRCRWRSKAGDGAQNSKRTRNRAHEKEVPDASSSSVNDGQRLNHTQRSA